ncbi:MAG TPA: Gfo/Idh/MocA family oxidoreductase [Ramlibacter sp.]|uniref:Gfo/Idh/MocA family protein n=1 Tax=Ramlibacter sp. TaxID=1917967 RepID=UPI002ED21131
MQADDHRVLIVGCGNIAGGFDAARNADAEPLTHAGAFVREPGFRLVACVDPDEDRRSAFQRRWKVEEAFADVASLGDRTGAFDVISICSPTGMHGGHLEAALALRPRLVFCEKPVTPSLAETRHWVERFEQAGIHLAVNHTRRWAPDVARLRVELQSGKWGSVRSAHGTYGKGVLNNGSHLIDLLQFLLGPLRLVGAGAPLWDFWETDPTVPALLAAGEVPVQLAVSNARDYSLFEAHLVTERGVISMEDGGLAWRIRHPVPSPHFSGYTGLDRGVDLPGEYRQAMRSAAINIRECLRTGAPLHSTGRTAADAQRLCEQISAAAAQSVSGNR